jgi:predicted AAA+ superfamily ATPase
MFGAVLVTGSRQVGKTTLLEQVLGAGIKRSLDDPLLLATAVQQAGTFFQDNPPPVFIDEVQYAPNLFTWMKIILDRDKQKGQFYMTGSQQFDLMKGVSESLAGRLGILILMGLSLREIHSLKLTDPFLPTEDFFKARGRQLKQLSYNDIWGQIHRGSMPELVANAEYDWQSFYANYVKTYIEKDVRSLSQVGDEIKFMQFITAAAARTGSLLNIASLAQDAGVSHPTAERWLSILKASNLVYLLRPFANNRTKRAVKTPKLYFTDTGLAAYLTRWPNADILRSGAMSGAFFETFVVSEIVKSYSNAGVHDLPLYFYRDRDKREVDLLIEAAGVLHPLEIKKHADPTLDDIAAFSALDNIPGVQRGMGGVVCSYDRLASLDSQNKVIPVWYL